MPSWWISVVKKSTKSAHSNQPNPKKIKKFYLLILQQVNPVNPVKNKPIFAPNAHIRAFIEALLFFAEGQKEGNDDCSMANSQLPTEPVLSVVEGNSEL